MHIKLVFCTYNELLMCTGCITMFVGAVDLLNFNFPFFNFVSILSLFISI